MFWLAEGLVYRRQESIIHSLDPRVKLIISFSLFILSLFSSTIFEFIILLSAIFLLGVLSKVLRRMIKTITFSLTFVIMIFVINLLVGYDLIFSIVISLRFIAIISSSSIFFLTSSPDELDLVMRSLHLPYDLIFAFVTAVRFVPVILLDAIQIIDSQRSRGLEIEKGNIFKRIRNYIPILIPLIVQSIIRSEELAEAMESRAYGFSKKRTSYYTLHFKMKDYLILCLHLMLVVLFILLVYFLHL
ncbi:MAG: energy-coupling factor transporter transmembrane protein EcfT [Nitrososphaeria archaeon]|nr:energy-coupling factor transporter transmembrane protein EcfT [Nitrososphaeria archaeon]